MASSRWGSRGENARGAPGHAQARRASIVLVRTLGGSGGRVLLTTILLIEEPERHGDQACDQGDFEDEKHQRQEQTRRELPQNHADQTHGGELQHWLDHRTRSRRWGPELYATGALAGFTAHAPRNTASLRRRRP